MTERDDLVAAFEAFERGAGARAPGWIAKLRRTGIASFAERGFPGPRDEEWRCTNVSPIARGGFREAEGARPLTHASVAPHSFGESVRLVFVDGAFRASLSDIGHLPPGVRLMNLAAAAEEVPELVQRHLGRHADLRHPFVGLNTAFLRDGAFLHVPTGHCLTTPIHILHLSSGESRVRTHPRTLVAVGESGHATVVETYASIERGPHFTNPVTEVVAAANASIDHYRVQVESEDAMQAGTIQIAQERDSNVVSHVFHLGGALVRSEVNGVLGGEGGACTLNGLALAGGRQHIDNHTRLDHKVPRCESHELYKGIWDGHSSGVFSGRIHVHPDAQKTDAKQSNHNLLLSEEATVDTRPQLEIFADDVRCTHGATIGRLDRDALFYLRSRGIGEKPARALLIYAFAAEVCERVRVVALREKVERMVLARLPGGLEGP